MRLIFQLRLHSYLLEKYLLCWEGKGLSPPPPSPPPPSRLQAAWQGATFHPPPRPLEPMSVTHEAEICPQVTSPKPRPWTLAAASAAGALTCARPGTQGPQGIHCSW